MAFRRKLRRGQGLLYTFAGIGLLLFYGYILPAHLDVKKLVDKESCPACFADNLCGQFQSGEFELVGWHRFSLLSWFNGRNVYQAVWKPISQAVVLKKLATDNELAQIDSELCKYFHNGQGEDDGPCDPGKSVESLENRVFKEKSDLLGLSNGQLSSVTIDVRALKTVKFFDDVDLLQCVDNQVMMDWLVHYSLHHSSTPHLHNLITILLTNQEPIIPMVFPQSRGSFSWPFPEYYGGCGRLAVFQYIGQPLDSYYNYPWLLRAHFALQLLKIAQNFSSNKEKIALYPTDWSANNFAVDWSSKQIYLVDMENIIIVNQTRIKERRSPGWDTKHAADRFGCDNCFSFHVQDLCTHMFTDHNFHGVCGGLLSRTPYSPGIPGGFLHSAPSDVIARHPELLGLIEDCATSAKSGGRQQLAKLIMEILQSELYDVDLQSF